MKQNQITVSVEYVNFIMSIAPQFGFDIDQLYEKAGFDPAVLETPGTRIPFDHFFTIWRLMENCCSDSDFGLHLGEKASLFTENIVLLISLNSPTIKDSIEKFCQYFNLLTEFSIPVFSITENSAEIAIRFYYKKYETTRYIHEAVLAIYAAVLRKISDNKIEFSGIYFANSKPANISEHNRIFNTPLHFDQPENKLVFEKKYLKLPVRLANHEILELMEQLAKKAQKRINKYGLWSERVVRIIMNNKFEKQEIESVAKTFAVSSRNLQRFLNKEGTTYQKLVEQVRKEQAVYLLENNNLSINEIAYALGYSEQSAFSRAFKAWTGFTPGQYRSGLSKKTNNDKL